MLTIMLHVPRTKVLEALRQCAPDDVSRSTASMIEERLEASESWQYRLEVAQTLSCLGTSYLSRHSRALLDQVW